VTLGIALIIIFVLYLIDKHNRWRQTLKVVVALAVTAGLLYGSIYAYDRYATWRIAHCIAKSTPAGNPTAAAEIETACDHDPSKPLVLGTPVPTQTDEYSTPIPADAVIDKYPIARSVSVEESKRTCPWTEPVSEACQKLYTLPKGVSCVGKPFNVCMVEKPFDPSAPYSDLPAGAKVVSIPCGVDRNGHIVPDGKGGCIPPPPDGYIIDAPKAK
jgi:hypothetical protein